MVWMYAWKTWCGVDIGMVTTNCCLVWSGSVVWAVGIVVLDYALMLYMLWLCVVWVTMCAIDDIIMTLLLGVVVW